MKKNFDEKFVRLYDTVNISPRSIENNPKIITDYTNYMPGKPLRITLAATHAGRVTRNYGFYLPEKMREGAQTLLKPFSKPILTHHNEHADPIGRIVNATYVDTSHSLTRDGLISNLVKKLNDSNTPFYHLLNIADDLIESDILTNPDFTGLGYLLVTAEITDKEAIDKILDKRYLTVSTGASSDKAICSICKTDWVESGRCEHLPGKYYDDKLCVMITGSLIYDEISFVNAPADSLARVIGIANDGNVQDSVIAEQYENVVEVNASFTFQDSTDMTGGHNMNRVEEAWKKALEIALCDEKDKSERLDALKGFLAEVKDEVANPYHDEAEKKIKELEDEIKSESEMQSENITENATEDSKEKDLQVELEDEAQNSTSDEGKVKEENATVEDEASSTPETEKPNEEQDDMVSLTPEEEELFKLADEHYDTMVQFACDLALVDEFFEDKKLSSEERKKLKKSTFCKPAERKYPVPDCSHARVAMAYAKKNNEPSYVISCIRRKAKALGCPFDGEKSKDGREAWEVEIDEILADIKARSQQDSAEPEDQIKDEKKEDTCPECEKKDAQLKALRQELKDIYVEAQADEDAYLKLLNETKENLAQAVALLNTLTAGEVGKLEDAITAAKELKTEELIQKFVSVKDSINLDEMVMKINDGMTREPTETITDPTAPATEDPANMVVDKDTVYPGEESLDAGTKILYTQVRKNYKDMCANDPDEADAWIVKLKQEGLIPYNFRL